MPDKLEYREIESLIERGHPDAALERLAALDGAIDAQAAYLRGVALHKLGRVDQAMSALGSAIDAQPDHARALRQLALIHYWKDAPGAAGDLLLRALAANPKLAAAALHLGHIARRGGDNDTASAWYAQEISALPDHGHVHYHLGRALAKTGRFEKARDSLKAFTLDPAFTRRLRDGRDDILERTMASRIQPADPFRAAQDLQNFCGIGRTLVIGAGAAWIVRLLLRRGIDATAISGEADSMAAGARLAEGHFFTGSADIIPFDTASFSVVALLGCLNSLRDEEIDAALREAGRVSARWAVVAVAEEPGRDRAWWRRRIVAASRFRFVANSHAMGGVASPGTIVFLLEPRTGAQDAALEDAGLADRMATDPFIGWTAEADLAAWRGCAIRGAAAHLFSFRSHFLDLSGGNGAIGTVMSLMAGTQSAEIATAPGAATDYARRVFGSVLRNARFEDRPAEELAEKHARTADVVFVDGIGDAAGAQRAARLGRQATTGAFNALVILRAGAEKDVVQACVAAMEGAFNLRRIVTESPQPRIPNFTLHQAEDPMAAGRATDWATDWTTDWATGAFGKAASVTLIFAPGTLAEQLASLPWPEFNAAYGGIGSRPFMVPAERAKLADLLEQAVTAAPGAHLLWKAVVAALAEGYGKLTRSDLDAVCGQSSVDRLGRLEMLGLAMPVSPELIRWLMSIRRCQAMLYLAMGRRQAARERFAACIDKDYRLIVPHLLRHVLDSRFFQGLLDLGDGQPQAATEEWRRGVADFIGLAARMGEHAFKREFEFSENANLFWMGHMLLRAADTVGGKREASAPFGFQIGIANASVPQVVDRFGDRTAILGDLPQRLI